MKCVSTWILRCTSISRSSELALLFGITTLLTLPAHAQTELLMRATCGSVLTANEGDRTGFQDYVDLSSIHHELSAPVRFGPGGTVLPGTLAIEPIRIVKATSASSIGMISAMARGQVCTEILIENMQLGGSSQSFPVWRLVLNDAYIIARKEWHTAEDIVPVAPQESFELFSSRVTWTHFNLGDVTPIEFTWDFTTNSAP